MPITALLLAAPLVTAQLQGPGRRGEVIVNRPSASVVVDGERLSGGVIVSGANRVLVEMRPIFERLGARVDWIPDQQRINAFTPTRGIELALNSQIWFIGNEKSMLDSPPILRDNKVFVPLRAVSQAFDAQVQWEGGSRTARITTNKTAPRNNDGGPDGGGTGLGGGSTGGGIGDR